MWNMDATNALKNTFQYSVAPIKLYLGMEFYRVPYDFKPYPSHSA